MAEEEDDEDLNDLNAIYSLISRFSPTVADLECKLVPFIPDLIPATGEIDTSLRIPRPDGADEPLGKSVLDEPGEQSDASLLTLKLRALARRAPTQATTVQVRAAESPRDLDAWIDSVETLHRETHTTPVQTLRLPDVEKLMQEWDPEVEEVLATINIPPPDLDCSLEEYVSIICALLDVPLHSSKVASLHQVFSLYCEFRSSQHLFG